jgi:hypothetical protein
MQKTLFGYPDFLPLLIQDIKKHLAGQGFRIGFRGEMP